MNKNSSRNNNRNRGRNPRGRSQPQQLASRNSFRTTLVYASSMTYASTGATAQYYAFRGNSVFDPDAQIGGHQPLAFDQLAALYQKYEVHGSRLEITVINEHDATHPDKGIACVVYPTIQTAPVTMGALALDNWREQPWSQYTRTGIATSAAAVRNFSMPYKATGAVFGQNPSDQDFKADVTTNPLKQWYWLICFHVQGQGTPTLSMSFNVKIYYDVTFYSRKTLTSS